MAMKFNSKVHIEMFAETKGIISVKILRFKDFERLIKELILHNEAQIALDLYLIFLTGCKKEALSSLEKEAKLAIEHEESFVSETSPLKDAIHGCQYLTKQFFSLARTYQWSRFNPKIEKLLADFKEVFGFSFSNLRSLYSIATEFLFKSKDLADRDEQSLIS